DHANVLKTHRFVAGDKGTYLEMELFKHPNLKQWSQRDETDVKKRLPQVAVQAAKGLAHLHDQGWVHRDVKPDNYLVDDTSDEPRVKLIDFALAQKPKGMLGRLLQGKGKVQGTMSYMAPEQIRGESIDARADIYSFGCLLFELLTGKTPYAGDSSQDLLKKHLRAAVPSVKAANTAVSDEAAKIVQNTLAKKPDDRPQSMREVALTLKAIPLFA
ncbi:MAG: serine/threonine protein kinase, partial [Pirellulales bacterium]|nr:serine/threonine protein kinase [Pirellulales bacterium]